MSGTRRRRARQSARATRKVESAPERSLRWSAGARALAVESAAARIADPSDYSERAPAYRRASRSASVSAAAAMLLLSMAGVPEWVVGADAADGSVALATVFTAPAALAPEAAAERIAEPSWITGPQDSAAIPSDVAAPARPVEMTASAPRDPSGPAPVLADPARCVASKAHGAPTIVASLPESLSAAPVPQPVAESAQYLAVPSSPQSGPHAARPLIEIIPSEIGRNARSVIDAPMGGSIRPEHRPAPPAAAKSVSVVATCGYGAIVKRGNSVFHRPPNCI